MAIRSGDALPMAPNEVFPTPLVKQVAFEIRFPNLFFLESRIGEFQVQVMKDFPQSDLALRRNVMIIAGNAENPQLQDLAKQQSSDSTEKIWQFKAESGIRLEISTRNLVLVSPKHTSYHEGEKSFRSIVEKTLSEFFNLTQLPIVMRVGLRYSNECPLFNRTTETFNKCYDSILPVNRFGLENLNQADCVAVAKSGDMQIQRMESLRFKTPSGDILVLDLDASAENIVSDKVVATTDKLHDLVANEFRDAVKEPVLEYMRGAERK
jgi:uncharacterized protein (TIGR04255 family)